MSRLSETLPPDWHGILNLKNVEGVQNTVVPIMVAGIINKQSRISNEAELQNVILTMNNTDKVAGVTNYKR